MTTWATGAARWAVSSVPCSPVSGWSHCFIATLNAVIGNDATNAWGAAIFGVLGAVLSAYGVDMLYRALTGSVPPERFFEGRVGLFRALVGGISSLGLCLALLFYFGGILTGRATLPRGISLGFAVGLALSSAAVAVRCAAVLRTRVRARLAPTGRD